MKRFCYTCLFALVLVACGATRNDQLLQAVTFSYGNYGPSDVRQLLAAGADVSSMRFGFSLLDEAVMYESCGNIASRYTRFPRDRGAKLVKYAEEEIAL